MPDHPAQLATVVEGARTVPVEGPVNLRHISCTQLVHLDRLLGEVGEFGEIRLIVDRGVIKFVEVLTSRRL